MKSSLHTFLHELPQLWKIIFLLQVLIHINGFSQFSFYKNYTSNDGLPSSKIYDMLQDSKGYMWFATENGVSRFDGYEFKNFSTIDGLPANSTIRLYEDYHGRIWFASFMGFLSYYVNDRIIPYSLNDELLSIGVPQFFDNIYIDSNETMWLSPYDRGFFRISSDSIIHSEETRVRIAGLKDLNEVRLYYFYENGELVTWSKLKHGISEHSDQLSRKKVTFIEFPHILGQPYYQNYQCIIDSNNYLFSMGLHLAQIKNGEIIANKSYKNEVLSIFYDNNQNIWVSEQFNCLFMYPDGNIENEPIKFLHDHSVSKVLQDKEGSYWFSTTENGVYYVPSIDFSNYNKDPLNINNDVIITLETLEDQLFFTTDKKGIHSVFIRDGKIENNPNFKIDGFIRSNIYDILITDNKYLWLSDSEHLIYHLDGSKATYKPTRHIGGYEFLQLMDESVLLSHRTGYHKYQNFQLTYKSSNNSFIHRTYPIYETHDSTLLLGTFDGMYKYKNEEYSKFDSICPVLNSRISDIKYSNGNLWVGTFNNGIAVNSKKECYYINQENGLYSNRVKIIFIEDEQNIWIGTNKGLCHIIVEDLSIPTFEFINYTIWDGLPSNEINDIIKHNDLLWLGTDKGLVSFNPRKVKKPLQSPSLYLEKLLVNGKVDHKNRDSLIFNFDENNITFEYKAISFKDPGNIIYNYRLEGLEEEWLETKNTSVRYPELEYGTYKFQVIANNVDRSQSEALAIDFTIRKHFTQTILFIIITILAGFGFVSTVYLYFFTAFKRREKLKQQVIMAEQTALRAQMNPHFIFNALNSIQDFVLKRDDKNANFYLTNFSTLIRKILETSKSNTISLKEEIETIQIYLNIEKLRFEGLFNYSINIEKTINLEETFIPPMLLQTYIENAIWHGLVPKNTEGLLEINFKLINENRLSVSIEDNGIGRKKAIEIGKQRRHHKSIGMKNARERIDLINQLNNTKTTIDVIDLYDNKNLACGTRIEIKFDN